MIAKGLEEVPLLNALRHSVAPKGLVTQSSSHLAAEDALFPAEELNQFFSRAGGILI